MFYSLWVWSEVNCTRREVIGTATGFWPLTYAASCAWWQYWERFCNGCASKCSGILGWITLILSRLFTSLMNGYNYNGYWGGMHSHTSPAIRFWNGNIISCFHFLQVIVIWGPAIRTPISVLLLKSSWEFEFCIPVLKLSFGYGRFLS